MRRVVCPGSFDPITNGHLDIIGRASQLFDEVFVAVGVNAGKAGGLFTVDERMDLVRRVTADYGNVRVEPIEGLLVDFCARHGIRASMKGLRAVSDYEYELQMSHMNHRLAGIETLFVASNPLYSYLSSSLLKEVAALGGDVSGLVPDLVLSALTDRLAERKAKSA
ncbi:pantetheine-phosphate adenylyltransferase [Catenulispora subtropica]|uniref:pantetheine-phosphate adenylyltransferase n=1 Tax=Catenulispora subtropica TaxID=450798 RepID=UPI0031DFA58F